MDIKWWNKYEQARSDFRKTHKPAKCCECGCNIYGGDDIVVIPCSDKIFCSNECLVANVGALTLLFNKCDEDYASWFDRSDMKELF